MNTTLVAQTAIVALGVMVIFIVAIVAMAVYKASKVQVNLLDVAKRRDDNEVSPRAAKMRDAA